MVFREEQHFASRWLVVLLVILAAVGVSMGIGGLAWGSAGATVGDIVGLAVGLVLAVALPLAFTFARLVTDVAAQGLRVRLAPFQRHGRWIGWEQVSGFAAVKYNPIRDYGGWGVRGTRRKGAYNARGDRGVMLDLVDGSRFLVGSQRPDELETAISMISGRPAGRAAGGAQT